MSDEDFADDAEPVDEDDLAEDDMLDADLDEDDDLAEDDDLDTDDLAPVLGEDGVEVDPAAPMAPEPSGRTKRRRADDDEDALELDEELHPDDVEAPLDALLQEKTAAATMEDEEEELEDEESDADALVDGPAKIVPRRPGEFVCRSCFLVLPRHQLADEERMLCRDCA